MLISAQLLGHLGTLAADDAVDPSQKSQIRLIHNAAMPIFLAREPRDRQAAARRLESLIQGSRIRQVAIVDIDQQPLARAMNHAASATPAATRADFPVRFQGALAGTVQVEMLAAARTPPPGRWQMWLLMMRNAAALTVFGGLLWSIGGWAARRWGRQRTSELALPPAMTGTTEDGTEEALLLYLYPCADASLRDEPELLRQCLDRLYQKIEGHLRFYGGQTLSLSSECQLCRLPLGKDPASARASLRQALTFTWGSGHRLLFPHGQRQYRIDLKTLLHHSRLPPGSYPHRALNAIAPDQQAAIRTSRWHAHLSEPTAALLAPSGIQVRHKPLADAPALHAMVAVDRTTRLLWQKQEEIALQRAQDPAGDG
ncbi:MAG: hypothetical protein GDA55_08295 [Cellvibrionales bacterium]|nr:hypothetical protein [Cellvibrionales bacterium]